MTWSPSFDGRFAVVLAVGLAGLLFLAFRLASAPSARSTTLLALRAAALGVLVLILLNPMRVQQVKLAGPAPTAVFLLDESRSMSLETPITRAQAVRPPDRPLRCSAAVRPTAARPGISFWPRPDRRRRVGKGPASFSRRNAAGPGPGRATVAFWRHLAVWRVRLFRRPVDGTRVAGNDRAGLPSPGRADPCRARGRRTDRRRRGFARYRRPARCPARDARAGSGHASQPRLRWRAHRDLHPRGRRPQGRSAGDPSHHSRRRRASPGAGRRGRPGQGRLDGPGQSAAARGHRRQQSRAVSDHAAHGQASRDLHGGERAPGISVHPRSAGGRPQHQVRLPVCG